MRKTEKRKSSIDTYEEWLEHQYDPGYYLGGRIPSYLLGKRPNKWGYAPLTTGFLFSILFVVVFLVSRPTRFDLRLLIGCVAAGGFVALQLASGLILLRKPRERDRHKRPKA